jgi:alcohol dehydrogenase class IV
MPGPGNFSWSARDSVRAERMVLAMSLITYVTRIHFADRVLEDALPEELSRLGVRRILIVTDAPGDGEDIFERVTNALPAGCDCVPLRGIRTPVEPQEATHAIEVIATMRCDAVLGLGGPAALDLARLAGQGVGGARSGPLPVIAVPTTTASVGLGPLPQGTRATNGRRTTAGCQPVPAVVLCDPTLTLATDPMMTAASGMDALTHCIETYLGTTWNPPADGIALEGVRRAGAYLERAVRDGQDLEARREVLAAALNAGLAAQKGLGGVHALAHALENEAGLSARHGWMHAALLPPMLGFNAPAVGDRFAALCEALRLGPGADLPKALAALGARLSLPLRLDSLRLDHPALKRVARKAADDPANLNNPRLAHTEDYLRILEEAL